MTVFKNKLTPFVAKNFPWAKLPEQTHGLSLAEITQIAEDAIKDLLMRDGATITFPHVQAAISERQGIAQLTASLGKEND